MSNKKIDKLFQERFSDFEEAPDKKVWNAIETSLNEKKKSRRVIPIWWQLTGVAALIAVLFAVINPFQEPDVNSSVVDTENVNNKETNTETNSSEADAVFTNGNEDEVVVTEDRENSDSAVLNSEVDEANVVTNTNVSATSNVIVGNRNNEENNGDAIVLKGKLLSEIENETAALANETIDEEETVLEAKVKKEKLILDLLPSKPSEEAIVVADEDDKEQIIKKSIFDEIEENKAEELELVDADKAKWSVGPSVAPVYFNGLGDGSPIDSDFVSNSKSGNVNMSYGMVVSYEISKKLSLRSGVYKVDLGYDTHDISFISSFGGAGKGSIANVDYSKKARSIIVSNEISITADALNSEISFNSPILNGNMSQHLGYIEVPFELDYMLLDKKFGINLIGGFSSLFLLDNAITLESEGLVTEIGEANNINTINFSTNAGVGLHYKISPKTVFNVEPMFKYHLNTFNRTSGDFKPFSLGVYSGIKLKF